MKRDESVRVHHGTTWLDVSVLIDRVDFCPVWCKCGYKFEGAVVDRYVEEVGSEWGLRCPSCGLGVCAENVNVGVSEDSKHLLDLGMAKEREYWYHFSDAEDWPKFKPLAGGVHRYEHKNFWAHVGTLSAALDRMHALECDFGTLYKIRIRPEAVWAEGVAEDDGWLHGIECAPGEANVIRYRNRFESPGSVSLAVCNEMVEVVSRKDI